MNDITLLWLRHDLRLQDNSALQAAIERGAPVLAVYLWAPDDEGSWPHGAASRWWLHHALVDLDAQLRQRGGGLQVVDAGGRSCEAALLELCREARAGAVYWNRRYEPFAVSRDRAIKSALRSAGFEVKSFGCSLLFEPTAIRNKAGTPFRVFTPFWKHLQTLDVPRPVDVDLDHLRPCPRPAAGGPGSLGLLPSIPWDRGFEPFWGGLPTRDGSLERLDAFIEGPAASYPDDRDAPALQATSRLSPCLHVGQIGPREAWWRLAEAPNHVPAFRDGVMRQLVWREFAHHLLFHFPDTAERPLRPEFERFPWRADEDLLGRWQCGETGYPIVDAGMRQLWQTGWMHNRVRMVVASFLVKHLLVGWQEGARWFWDTLVDADLANNTFGWQWTAGCGADASPFFRIFNPITQGVKFDPQGEYVRRYLPELEGVPAKFIHSPWEMGELELSGCGIVLGRDYPEPCVDHAQARQRALDALATLKN